jgi:hypothetical protein
MPDKMSADELEALVKWLDESPQIGMDYYVIQSANWQTLRNEAPRLIAVLRAAEKVARFDWGTAGTTESYHDLRMAAMNALRAAVEGG